MSELLENNVQWYTGDDTVTASFTQKKFINRFRNYAEKKQEVDLVAQNKDGSICVRFPLSWVKISPPRQMSEEDRLRAAERLRLAREKKENAK